MWFFMLGRKVRIKLSKCQILVSKIVINLLLSLKSSLGSQFDTSPFFPDKYSKERVKPFCVCVCVCVYVCVCGFYYYHKSHLSCRFHWNSLSSSEDMKIFSANVSFFHHVSSIFWTSWHFLVTKKLMTSAYNRWY